MANISRRGKRWRAQIFVHGQRQSATFRTRQEAALWALEREGELTQGRRGATPLHTLHEALGRYADEVSPFKRGERWERIRLAALQRDLPFVGERLDRITPEAWGRWRDLRLKAVGPGTVLRDFNLIAAVYEAARKEWRWVQANPIRDVRKPRPPKARDREFTAAEVKAIVKATGFKGKVRNQSHEVAVALLFALETAMRAGEICSLGPDQVRGRVAYLDQTKNGDSREVPLSTEAVRLWKLLPAGFTIKPKMLDALFRKYRDRAGIVGVTFHDSRRTATGRLAKKLEVLDLAKMTGHKDIKTLLRVYYAPQSEKVAKLLG